MMEKRESPVGRFVDGLLNDAERSLNERLARTLRSVRSHLGMDVAFLSEFADGRRIFRSVDTPVPHPIVEVGASHPLEESVCRRIVSGELPQLICDTSLLGDQRIPAAVGAHLSVPVVFSDGRVYGTLCCFSAQPNYALGERDVRMMRVLAEVAAEQLQLDLERQDARAAIEARLEEVLAGGVLSMVFQPITALKDGRVVGFESLSRFKTSPYRTPDVWFRDAAEVGRGVELELEAVQLALQALGAFPASVYVSINASPESLLTPALASLLEGVPLDRVVLEVTEHKAVDRYEDIASVLTPLRRRDLRVAVDDAGAGYSSFRHILSLAPDVIKLDLSITRDIDRDVSRRALATALIGFGSTTGASIIAEGVETAAELQTLRALGVNHAQGYFVGKPTDLLGATQRCARE